MMFSNAVTQSVTICSLERSMCMTYSLPIVNSMQNQQSTGSTYLLTQYPLLGISIICLFMLGHNYQIGPVEEVQSTYLGLLHDITHNIVRYL